MQLPSIVSQRVDQSSQKFATADRWGVVAFYSKYQLSSSVRYLMTVCVKTFLKRLRQLKVGDLAEG